MKKKQNNWKETMAEIILFAGAVLFAGALFGAGFYFWDEKPCYAPVSWNDDYFVHSDTDEPVYFLIKCQK